MMELKEKKRKKLPCEPNQGYKHLLAGFPSIWLKIWLVGGIHLKFMGGKKKLLKGLKYISQLFGYKEHELEIGYPTDVRHVAHVGWDGPMNEIKTADFSSNALSNSGQSRETSWISQDFDQPRGLNLHSEIPVDGPCPGIPKAPKKTRQKKSKLKSPSSSSRTSKSQGFICRG